MTRQLVNSRQNGVGTGTSFIASGDTTITPYFGTVNLYIVDKFGINTPNFRALQKSKVTLPVNPYTLKREVHKGAVGAFTVRERDGDFYPGTGTRYEGVVEDQIVQSDFQPVYFDSVEIAACDAIARNKILLKLKDQKINLAQAFAERKQTANLIASTATRLASMLVALRNGNLTAAAKALGVAALTGRKAKGFKRQYKSDVEGAAARALLEMRYGWQPLLNDVYGAAELLAQQHYGPPRGRAVSQHTIRKGFRASKVVPLQYATEEFHQIEHTTKYVIGFSIGNVGLQSLSSLGITNPALLLYELTPWSFVVDWFIPLGNWISTWDATFGLDFSHGSVTNVDKSDVDRQFAANNVMRTYSVINGLARGSSKCLFISRGKLIQFPDNATPAFKNPFSTQHAQNAIALLQQTFLKKR